MTEIQYDTSLIAQLFDTQPDPVLWFFPIFEGRGDVISDFEIRYCNAPAAKLLHQTSDVLTSSRLSTTAAFDEETRLQIIAQCNHVMATGEAIQTNSFNASLNKHFSIRRSKVLNGILTIARDRTREVNADAERRRVDDRLNSVMEASIDSILVLEPVNHNLDEIVDLKILSVNKAGAQLLQCNDDTRELPLSGFLETNSFDRLIQLHKQVLQSNSSLQSEEFVRFPGGEGWFTISISPCNDGTITVLRECTELKKLEEQLEFTVESLKRSNERLTEFTYVASHDLSEPLRKVATFSKLLSQRLGENLESGAKDYLSRIENSIQRMQVLLENLLVYSRVSKPVTRFDRVSLNAVVREAQLELNGHITAKGVKLKVDDLPDVDGDATQLRQVFLNILTNAIKFQPTDRTPVITIFRRGELSDSEIIDISDNGIGFDPDYSLKIFELFHRLHSRHEYEGTGIGLAIVQRAMENHKGSVEVQSELGKGSVFSLHFPKINP